MKVILKEDVRKLGSFGDEVEIADGYGRNYLIPKGIAVPATANNKSIIAHKKNILQEKLKKTREDAESFVNKLLAVEVVFKRKVGEKEKLFGSVTSQDIAELLNAKGFEIDKRKILLDEPIKSIGFSPVSIKIHPDVPCTINVQVEKEEEENAASSPSKK